MIAVVQRVRCASVRVDGDEVASIGPGFLALVGVLQGDSDRDVDYVAQRLTTLRIMPDADGKMNRSLRDVEGELLLVSQFTLAADTRKGRRPSFARAMPPDVARPMLERLESRAREAGVGVSAGVFGAHMEVQLVNDGPVTVLLDSRQTRRGGRRGPSDCAETASSDPGQGDAS